MENLFKVSIIVAIYNSEKFLDKLIQSLINQTYNNIEIILVDDGSPDNSGVICDNYAAIDERIHVIHKINGGTCEARNYGLNVATGDYIMIVDGDDWLELDCVEYLLNVALTTKAEMAYSDKVFTTRDRKQTINDSIEIWSSEKAAAMIIYPHMLLGPWNKIYKKDLLQNNNITFSVPWFGEGLYFATTAAQHANYVGVGHKKVYNYRLNNANSGLTTYNVQKGINARQNIYTIQKELYLNTPYLNNAVNWHIWKNHSFLLLQIIGSKEVKKYKAEYKECIKYIRKNAFKVCVESDISLKEKIKVLLCGMMPVIYNKIVVYRRKRGLKKDLLNDY